MKTRNCLIFVSCLILILLGCPGPNYSKSADLNGDFEHVNDNTNLPYNWNFEPLGEFKKGTIKFLLDNTDYVSGKQSLKIENLSWTSAGIRSYGYSVDSGVTYKVIINFKNPDSILKFRIVAWSNNGKTPRRVEMILDESFDHWVEVSNQITIREKETKLTVSIWLEDNGTAWLDNIQIVNMN